MPLRLRGGGGTAHYANNRRLRAWQLSSSWLRVAKERSRGESINRLRTIAKQPIMTVGDDKTVYRRRFPRAHFIMIGTAKSKVHCDMPHSVRVLVSFKKAPLEDKAMGKTFFMH